MDEVPIPNNNPVIIRPQIPDNKSKPKKPSRLLDTFKNFIYMFPLALIISYQLFWLGHRFGEFITFPPTSVISYIFIGSILLMLLVIQIMMRSIIYSILVGIMFTAGIFSAYFGNVYEPVISNLTGGIDIIKSAWTRKDIPFQLVVAGTMSSIIIGIALLQFMVSLLVKSFFEMIFGKNWGDGKWMGYLGAIALIFGIYISFNSYHKYSNDNKEKLIWSYYQVYNPLEKFITRTPGNVTYNEDYVWINNGSTILSKSITNGKTIGEKRIQTNVVCKGIQQAYAPIAATENKFICFTHNLDTVLWEIAYPMLTASDTENIKVSDKINEESKILIPLTINFIDSGKKMLAFFDYGKIGIYDLEKGEELWCETIDQPVKISRLLPDRYLNDISYLENNNKLIIACKNGYVKSIDIKTGKIDWEYQHTVAKIGGKPQRGYLSKYKENSFAAAFKTGEIVTLSYKDGHIIHKAVNEAFAANNPVWCYDTKVHFITDEGLYYKALLDGGEIESRLNALPNKAEIYPIVQNNEHGIYAHRENIYHITHDSSYSTNTVFSCKNRTFVTNPVFVDKTMYIGTQDGWIFCLHYGSKSVKWVGHADGELTDDSLAIFGNKLIVKTKSDSVFVFNREYVQ